MRHPNRMNNIYQLFLKLRKAEESHAISSMLKQSGFQLFKQSGSTPSEFRNYYFRLPGASNQCEVQIRLAPDELNVSTVSVQLFFGTTTSTLSLLFDKLIELQQKLPFNLLDFELRYTYLEELKKDGKVNEFYAGLNEAQEMKIERNSYIPVNYNDFQSNLFNIEKRRVFFGDPNVTGEKAPKDPHDIPTSKGQAF